MRCYDLLSEVTNNVNGTTHAGERRETDDLLEGGVVGNEQTTANGLQLRHGHVVQVGVGNKGESAADAGEVGRRDALEEVAVETERAVDRRERGHADHGQV